MNISKFLSKALGIYFLIGSIAMLVNMQGFINNINALINDKSAMFIIGFVTLIVGILMVVSHNIWQWHWRLIITLLAWLTLIKGTTLIITPQLLNQITVSYIESTPIAYTGAGFDFLLGLVLIYFGFIRK